MPKKKTARKPKEKSATLEPGTLINAIELQTIRLVESHAKLEIIGNALPDNLQTSVQINAGPSGDGTLLGNVLVELFSPSNDGAETKQSSISITAHFQCVFKSSVELPPSVPEDEGTMLNATVLQVLWPYVRAHVSALTLAMGVPQYTLQLMRFKTVAVAPEKTP